MSSFNLIPTQYLLRRERRRVLTRASWVFLLTLGVCAAASVTLGVLSSKADQRLIEMQRKQAISGAERATLTDLAVQRDELSQRLQLLRSLRGGLSAEQLVLSVEGALPENAVWFTDWQFVREGIITSDQETPQPVSYFLQPDSPQVAQDWQVMSQMNVRGQARDHSALSEFSRSLLRLPHVHDVKLQRTALAARQGESQRLVNFDLAIVVKSDAS